jgi:cell wall-associated NlpC family hydrolase
MRSEEASAPSNHCGVLPAPLLPVLLQGIVSNFAPTAVRVSSCWRCKHLEKWRLADLWKVGARADTTDVPRASCDGRGRRLVGALALTLSTMWAACASTGATPRPFPTPGSASPPATIDRGGTDIPADAYAVTGTALGFRGVPYRNGGADPNGFDCSGFTWYVFAQHGITLPRQVREQFQIGRAVNPDRLVAGDLVFFSTAGPGPSHVGISIGGDEFVHAPSSAGVVRVERLSSGYWLPRLVGARRIN